MLPLHEVLLARPARKEAKKLEKAAKDLHDVICQSEPYKDYGDANKATLQQIRNGDAPPVWSVNDARHRSDLEWIAHICMKACAYRNLVSSLELHKQCWTSLEICVEPAITLFGRQAPEVVSLLLLQLYASRTCMIYRTTRAWRGTRRKCEDLMDVKLEGEVSLPWLSARDPSMRYTSELLRAEATQHLAAATAAMGDPEGAIDIYERAIEQLTTLGDLGRLATCHHDCAGLLAVAALASPVAV